MVCKEVYQRMLWCIVFEGVLKADFTASLNERLKQCLHGRHGVHSFAEAFKGVISGILQ